MNAIVRFESGKLTPYGHEDRKNSRESGLGFSSPERDYNYDSAYLSPYDKHVLDSLEIEMNSKKKTIETSI